MQNPIITLVMLLIKWEELKDSVKYYKTLEINPNDKDAKHNLDFVKKKLKKN